MHEQHAEAGHQPDVRVLGVPRRLGHGVGGGEQQCSATCVATSAPPTTAGARSRPARRQAGRKQTAKAAAVDSTGAAPPATACARLPRKNATAANAVARHARSGARARSAAGMPASWHSGLSAGRVRAEARTAFPAGPEGKVWAS
ncbi:hypothetical protein MF672_019410 [Actinomadura sp. ATCC 31491]|uniref:Uncharacterized protein n=1 Tax=Actinomadura luzonensis TaxID=2805427 RepID=A0ABT0FUF5_9ACTN|nr:hypothetical protein [Actinomadura luzonensis]MCK2215947.1 hypothetical protein [Actinomadura luzonensis]